MAQTIPHKCTVLVIGGGPGGSFAAAVLALEGYDIVLLEAEKFPRYHIGESMLPSFRHFLKFIDLDEKFDQHGFTKKPGAAFKLHKSKREAYTDFLAAGGSDNYTWNVIRSEADDLMFRHAQTCGARVFDGVKVNSITFEQLPSNVENVDKNRDAGRPIRASFIDKETTMTGEIAFEYVIDASGRAGILSTKYLKNRKYNQSLKNVASWMYWSGAGKYEPGTRRDNAPFFEALQDETGWAWIIPLHNGSCSVGVVMSQKAVTEKKRSLMLENSTKFYMACLKEAPKVMGLLGDAQPSTDLKTASDYSYCASEYAFPYARIIGDAGCFIDPYFSSGVHLALTGGLSASLSICAAMRGHCTEVAAAHWHSQKVADSYTRFLLVVMCVYRQILSQEESVLSDIDEDNYDRVFALFRPIIQGTADVDRVALSSDELSKTLEFCASAFEPVSLDASNAQVVEKLCKATDQCDSISSISPLSPDQVRAVNHIRARQMMRIEDIMHISNFRTDAIGGYVPVMDRGSLGLEPERIGERPEANGTPQSYNAADGDLSLNIVIAG